MSLENDGGFASVRTTGRVFDLRGAAALLLRVKGDGRTLDGPPLDVSRVEEIRLLIGDARAGPFALVVDWIAVVDTPAVGRADVPPAVR